MLAPAERRRPVAETHNRLLALVASQTLRLESQTSSTAIQQQLRLGTEGREDWYLALGRFAERWEVEQQAGAAAVAEASYCLQLQQQPQGEGSRSRICRCHRYHRLELVAAVASEAVVPATFPLFGYLPLYASPWAKRTPPEDEM